jgi:hypothetical protein
MVLSRNSEGLLAIHQPGVPLAHSVEPHPLRVRTSSATFCMTTPAVFPALPAVWPMPISRTSAGCELPKSSPAAGPVPAAAAAASRPPSLLPVAASSASGDAPAARDAGAKPVRPLPAPLLLALRHRLGAVSKRGWNALLPETGRWMHCRSCSENPAS